MDLSQGELPTAVNFLLQLVVLQQMQLDTLHRHLTRAGQEVQIDERIQERYREALQADQGPLAAFLQALKKNIPKLKNL